MKAIRFNDTALLHGEIDGSLDYLSGIFSYLYLTPKEKITSSLKIWKKTFEYGKNNILYRFIYFNVIIFN